LDNKKKVRNLLLYLGIPILIIIITAAVLSTNKSTSPKTSELEQYFVQDMVDSFNIDYGSGQIEITLKEGMSPIKSTDSDSQSATTATQPATEQQKTQSNSKKSKREQHTKKSQQTRLFSSKDCTHCLPNPLVFHSHEHDSRTNQ